MTNPPLVTKVYCIEDMFVNTFFRFLSIILILKVNATNTITLATTFRIALALSFRLIYLYLLSINK